MLVHRDDPSLRTEVIHILPRYGIDPAPLIERLRSERDTGVRRALIVCLGGYAPGAIPAPLRGGLKALLLSWYGSDPDAGIHGAIDWVMRRRWDDGAALDAIDRGLRGPRIPADRGWFINPSGQTFAIFRGPVSFRMGTVPGTDPYAGGDEAPHERTINRSFAIGTREVTLGEFRLFLKENPDLRSVWDLPGVRMRLPSDDCAVGAVTWFDAVRYCNWLSAREGIPEDQWCYPKVCRARHGPAEGRARTHGISHPYGGRVGVRLPIGYDDDLAARALGATVKGLRLVPAQFGPGLAPAGTQASQRRRIVRHPG